MNLNAIARARAFLDRQLCEHARDHGSAEVDNFEAGLTEDFQSVMFYATLTDGTSYGARVDLDCECADFDEEPWIRALVEIPSRAVH